jgi:hypothetical protein
MKQKHIQKIIFSILLFGFLSNSFRSFSQQKDSIKSQIPFEGMDQTWQNGSDRRDSALLQNKYYTGAVIIDANYTYSFLNPIDHTIGEF